MNKCVGFSSMDHLVRERGGVAVINTLQIRPCSPVSLMCLTHSAPCAYGQQETGGRMEMKHLINYSFLSDCNRISMQMPSHVLFFCIDSVATQKILWSSAAKCNWMNYSEAFWCLSLSQSPISVPVMHCAYHSLYLMGWGQKGVSRLVLWRILSCLSHLQSLLIALLEQIQEGAVRRWWKYFTGQFIF